MKTQNALTLAEIVVPVNTSRRDAWNPESPDAVALVASVKKHGILQPVVVRKILDGYELVAGFQRYHAAQDAGLESIPVVIGEYTDREAAEVNIAENLDRKDLTPIDKAVGMERLKRKGWKQKDISVTYRCTPAYVSQLLSIIKKLDPENIEKMHAGELSVQAALAIINPPPPPPVDEPEGDDDGGSDAPPPDSGNDKTPPGSKELAQALAEIAALQQEMSENMECFRRLTELAKGLKDKKLGALMFDLMSFSTEDADEKIRGYLGKK